MSPPRQHAHAVVSAANRTVYSNGGNRAPFYDNCGSVKICIVLPPHVLRTPALGMECNNKMLYLVVAGLVAGIISDCVSNSIRVVKTVKQTAPVDIGYMDAFNQVRVLLCVKRDVHILPVAPTVFDLRNVAQNAKPFL